VKLPKEHIRRENARRALHSILMEWRQDRGLSRSEAAALLAEVLSHRLAKAVRPPKGAQS